MIVSTNPKPTLPEFSALMSRTDQYLNNDALERHDYYAQRAGKPLESDVKDALDRCAVGSAFEGTIEIISGARFPDIIAAKYYGVEVKSTKDNHWTSIGSSILESTRVNTVERIYMTFGKLGGNPIRFLSRPYEKVLCGIAVTHMPRYLIDMRLEEGETIFDKMGIPYDELRVMENPVEPVAQYYKSQLKKGERLWWTGNDADESVSATVRLWNTLSIIEKRRFMIYGIVNYPEIFAGDYDRYALWLTSQGIVDPHIRDQFSAGGTQELKMSDGLIVKMPGVFRRVSDYSDMFIRRMEQTDPSLMFDPTKVDYKTLVQRINDWNHQVSWLGKTDYEIASDVLGTLFKEKIEEYYNTYRDEEE
ncbi:MAG: hypothetical protein IJK06_05160 [Clostridia bacterium]|nr:hypothetical protein [Clostridia bacterium]